MSVESLHAQASARVGHVLNEKWTLEGLIGVGGMAAVYAGRHRNGARAAVKILHAELGNNPAVRERFLREGYAANRVEHRGAVQVLDDDIVKGGPDDGAAYLVMELLEGESLEDRAAHAPPIGEQEYLTVANGVLQVLEAAHEHGVVHRDLKPDNIFLARDPDDGRLRVKVLDFGLARLTESQSTTQFGLALGTPSYMSPEQAAGRSEEIDGRTDLFALGATGFRLLALRRVHEEENVVRLVGKMANDPAPPLRSVAPSVSERVAAIIDRALAFRREDRYSSAAAMRAEVQAARDVLEPESTRMEALPAAMPAATTATTVTTAPRAEATMALSESDLEMPSEPAAPAPPDAPDALDAPDAPRAVIAVEALASPRGAASSEEPAPTAADEPKATKRRRRSILPYVTVVFYGVLFAAYRWAPDAAPARDALTADATPALADGATAENDAAPPSTPPSASASASPSALTEVDAESDASSEPEAAPDARVDAVGALSPGEPAASSAPRLAPPLPPLPPAPTVSAPPRRPPHLPSAAPPAPSAPRRAPGPAIPAPPSPAHSAPRKPR